MYAQPDSLPKMNPFWGAYFSEGCFNHHLVLTHSRMQQVCEDAFILCFRDGYSKSTQNVLQTARQVIASKRQPKKTQKKTHISRFFAHTHLVLVVSCFDCGTSSFWDFWPRGLSPWSWQRHESRSMNETCRESGSNSALGWRFGEKMSRWLGGRDIPVTPTYPWSILRASPTPELLHKVLLEGLGCVVKFFFRWWFQRFFILSPWKEDPFWLIFFKWVETTT